MPVDNLIPLLYSPTPNTKPPVSTRLTGELWTNLADNQLGLINATQTAVPLIAVRFFSPNTAYSGGDFAIQAGVLYVAKAAVPIGPFNATQWTALQSAADMAALYLPLTGGQLTGNLSITQSFIVGNRALTIGSGDGLSYGTNGIVCEFSLTAGNVLSVNRRTGNGTAVAFYQQNTTCGSITVANSTTTAYNTVSDVRLKTDAYSFDAGPIIDQLEVYNFEWTSTPGVRAYGVMAQECNEVFPDAVTHIEHEDSWAVDYSKFVPLLLQEIKDLRARVAVLEGAKPT